MATTPPTGKPRALRWVKRLTLAAAGFVVVLLAGGSLWLRAELRASLPQLEGERPVAGLAAAVRVERDDLGVVTLRGKNRLDIARATGFLHAQDRFFQMDLQRRQPAGELAELFGGAVIEIDKKMRIHRFRHVAARSYAAASAAEKALVDAYAEGVNTGLAALGSRPFEYLLLQSRPAAWTPEDSYLVICAMYLQLQPLDIGNEEDLNLMYETLPEPLFRFLTPPGTEWDAPLLGEALKPAPIPGPDVVDLRTASTTTSSAFLPASPAAEPPLPTGSNGWVVAGTHTADSGAILANDMHLLLSVPNIWYRARFLWPSEKDGPEQRQLTGVTLPGTPLMVVGSNSRIAWGLTNSQLDATDLVLVDPAPDDEEAYLTADGPEPYERHTELIRVKGGEAVTLEVVETRWGPLLEDDGQGRRRALRWAAHGGVDFQFAGLETAGDVDEAVAVAQRSGIPTQNFMVADHQGRIAWTLAGRLPRRLGFEGKLSRSWADGTRRWEGWLAPEEVPRIVDPESGRLWTANNRVVDAETMVRLGHAYFTLGVRAHQIRDGLMALDRASIEDMLEIQLDDRVPFLRRWRELLLEVLTPEAVSADPRRKRIAEFVESWGARAAIDSVGYRLVRRFRLALAKQVFAGLTKPVTQVDPEFVYSQGVWLYEDPLWQLVSERPLHLLDPKYASWDEQLLAAVDATLEMLLEEGKPLAEMTWGQRNVTRIKHPLSWGVPVLGRWLDMPAEALPGDAFVPRVQGPSAGASQRMAVSPGSEQEGYFHMPGGQSGHPLSPFYQNSHEAWARGERTSFLPGTTVYVLTLTPLSGPG